MSYTAIVLDESSRDNLVGMAPEGWEVVAHHMTINIGSPNEGPAADMLGECVDMKMVTVARDNLVLAVGVETKAPSLNKIKHITIAVNRVEGGKPFFSNKLREWQPVEPVALRGVVSHVKREISS